MTVIKQEDFIQSICDAFQFISYYHPKDYIDALYKAWQKEENPAAKDAMTQILVNSRMCAENNRPICQDTGIATVFLKVGMNVQWDADMSVEEMVNEGVRRAYTWEGNTLRASVLADPAGKRQNTKNNTPAVIHMSIVPGDKVEVTCAAKGGGSENKLPAFTRSVRAIGATQPPEAIGSAGELLIERWSTPDRRFHNLRHLIDMLARVDELVEESHNPDIMRVACWYHGCVFSSDVEEVIRGNGGEDETASAAFAEADLRHLGVPMETIKRVCCLIVNLKRHMLDEHDIDAQALIDADLGTLAVDAVSRYHISF